MTVTDRPPPFYVGRRVTIWHGNALALPIPDESVDLIVTSPPYFGLRSYQDAGEHYEGQIGSEATPVEFVDALIAATAEMVRVLKPCGSIWVNLGDKYASYEANRGTGGSSLQGSTDRGRPAVAARSGLAGGGLVRNKSLMGLPWRYALRCIDELGLILRAEVIWAKPNGLPESVTDRVRRSHETWFHLTREPRYFSAVDEIREEHAATTVARAQPHRAPVTGTRDAYQGMPGQTILRDQSMNPLGKLPGSVWEVPTQPLKVPEHLGIDHFAAFPMEWPRRIIRGWSPAGICVECGEGRRPIADVTRTPRDEIAAESLGRQDPRAKAQDRHTRAWITSTRDITGYACACDAPTAPIRPAVVLDPFGGTGTTALVAKALGRIGWHVDLSADYCRLAQWRVNDPDGLARAMQVEKPPAVPEDMDSLFDLLGEIA